MKLKKRLLARRVLRKRSPVGALGAHTESVPIPGSVLRRQMLREDLGAPTEDAQRGDVWQAGERFALGDTERPPAMQARAAQSMPMPPDEDSPATLRSFPPPDRAKPVLHGAMWLGDVGNRLYRDGSFRKG